MPRARRQDDHFGGNILSFDYREPLGVIGIIGAWNFPINMFSARSRPRSRSAMPSSTSLPNRPRSRRWNCAKLIAECLPPGIVNILTGAARPQASRSSRIRISARFRLPGRCNRAPVMAAAAPSTKQFTLELGGKNAQIVFEDADLDRAAQGIMLGAFMNQGQVCTSGSRVFVHHSVAKQLQEKVLALIPQLKLGDPFDKATTMGTMVFEEHLDSVMHYIDIGKSEGAKLVDRRQAAPGSTNIRRRLRSSRPYSADVECDMVVAREEIFGPVVTFHNWSDRIRDAGLGEPARFRACRRHLDARISDARIAPRRPSKPGASGSIATTCFPSGSSFGGTKASGFGREDAFETMFAFTQVKNVIADISEKQRSFYQ